jgi:hypothetical protein
MFEANAFRTFIGIYPLFKSKRLRANIKTTLHKALIIISNDLCLPRLGISARHLPLKIAAPAKKVSPHHWKFSKVHIGQQLAHGFQLSVCTRLYNKIMQATISNQRFSNCSPIVDVGVMKLTSDSFCGNKVLFSSPVTCAAVDL